MAGEKTSLALLVAVLLVLTGCGAATADRTAPSPSPTLGPAPGPECDKIWIEDKTLPDEGFEYDGCYQVVDGSWTKIDDYTECTDGVDNTGDPSDDSRLWEYTNSAGVLLYAFTGGRAGSENNGYIDSGDAIGELSGAPAIETARSVCTDG